MNTKTLIWIGLALGALLGGWLGSLIDHNPFFGLWSAGLGSIGAIAGIFLVYKLSQHL